MSSLNRWSICNASTAASSASKEASNQRELIVRGAAWSHPTSAASTTVFAVYLDASGTASISGAGTNTITDLSLVASKLVDAKWGTSSPGAAVMAFTVWGDYR